VASGVYSARKQYVPAVPGANVLDVACPLLIVTAPPTCVPPVVQSGGDPFGPQTKNETVPVTAGGLLPEPVNVAVSVTD
jgi:hypothetical protein